MPRAKKARKTTGGLAPRPLTTRAAVNGPKLLPDSEDHVIEEGSVSTPTDRVFNYESDEKMDDPGHSLTPQKDSTKPDNVEAPASGPEETSVARDSILSGVPHTIIEEGERVSDNGVYVQCV